MNRKWWTPEKTTVLKCQRKNYIYIYICIKFERSGHNTSGKIVDTLHTMEQSNVQLRVGVVLWWSQSIIGGWTHRDGSALTRNVQLLRTFVITESCWHPQLDLRFFVNEDALQFQLTVQQQNAAIAMVSNQQVTFAVQWQVTRPLDVSEWSQYLSLIHISEPTRPY